MIDMPRKIEISHRTIVFTVVLLLGLWFLFYIRDIIIQVFVALFIMFILNPTVRKLRDYKIPKGISVLIVYFTALGILIFSIVNIIPPLAEQTSLFVNRLPFYLDQLGLDPSLREQLDGEFVGLLRGLPGQVLNVSVSVVSNIVTFITVLIFAFYLLMNRDKLDDQLKHFIGDKKSEQIEKFIDQMELELGGWARGQLALMFLVGLASYIGLILLGIPYAVPLALLAGVFEAIPYLGPNLSAIPAIIIGFGISPIMGLAVVALYFLIQQVENSVFVPKVMERSVGISPLVTLLALLIGFKIAGIVGILLSVPTAITIRVLLKQYTQNQQN